MSEADAQTPTMGWLPQIDVGPPVDLLAAALAEFQAEMPTVHKGKTARVQTKDGGSYSYTYADLADVSAAAMPVLARHGLSFATIPTRDGLVGMLLHSSGQRLTGILPINGATPQQVGSSLTYMRRYLLGCLTGIVTDDDDDGQQAEDGSKAAAARRARQRPPVAPSLATEEHPAPDGSVDVPLPEPEQVGNLSPGLSRAMHAGLGEVIPEGCSREDRLAIVSEMIGRTITTTKDLTRDEAMRVMGVVERVRTGVAGIEYVDDTWQVLAYSVGES